MQNTKQLLRQQYKPMNFHHFFASTFHPEAITVNIYDSHLLCKLYIKLINTKR